MPLILTGTTSGGKLASHFTVDDTNDRIGIGTTSPTVLLDLESTATTIKFTDTDATGTPECEVSGAGGDLILRADKDNEKSSSLIAFEIDGSEKMRISGSNVGIGTTNPTEKLTLAGDSNFLISNTSGLMLRAANDFAGIGLNRNVATGAIFDATIGAFQLHNLSGALELQQYLGNGSFLGYPLFVSTAGKVGINENSPDTVSYTHLTLPTNREV